MPREGYDSKKTEVIEILFEQLWPEGAARPLELVVTNDAVVKAIIERNKRHAGDGTKSLSTNNPANFLKDFIRHETCNDNWPQHLKDRRITARQLLGNKRVMEFIDYRLDQELPFPDRLNPKPGDGLPIVYVEALSIPREARSLGREDEAWLTQVVVSQRIIETHLAVVASEHGLKVETLAHLQMSVKTQPEIDATFVATVKAASYEIRAYIVCEAKQRNERILEDQIREQISKAFGFTEKLKDAEKIDAIIPVAIKVIEYRPTEAAEPIRGIYVVQFPLISRDDFVVREELGGRLI